MKYHVPKHFGVVKGRFDLAKRSVLALALSGMFSKMDQKWEGGGKNPDECSTLLRNSVNLHWLNITENKRTCTQLNVHVILSLHYTCKML